MLDILFMTKEELMVLLHNPELTGQSVDMLSRLVEEYPYFHTGHQLYLKGLRQTDEMKMALQLKKAALCVRDRDVLYHYINHSSPQKYVHPVQGVLVQTEEESFTPVEIRDIYSEKQLVDDLIKSTHKRTNITETLPQLIPVKEETKERNATTDENRVWSPSELIDYFLKTNPKIVPNDKQYFEVDLSEIQHDSQSAATETLADIYATQGHKDKAIEIYEQLILKNPEKHIYFAAQIERLKE